MRGWFKVGKEIIKRAIFSDAELLRLFIYLKADANIVPSEQLIDGEPVVVYRGQGTYGRNLLAAALKVNPSTLYKRLKKLEKLGFIKLRPYKEMTVYTVIDYDEEQSEEPKVTAKCQPQALEPQGIQGFEESKSNSNGTQKEQPGNTLKEGRNKKEDIINTPYQKIKELYQSICKSFPKIRSITDERKKHLNARWKEYDQDIAIFEELFKKAEASDFLTGRQANNKNWKCSGLDWLINQQNMAKVLEGKYDNKGKPQPVPQEPKPAYMQKFDVNKYRELYGYKD